MSQASALAPMVNHPAQSTKPCRLSASPERGLVGGARRFQRRANVPEGGQIVGLVLMMPVSIRQSTTIAIYFQGVEAFAAFFGIPFQLKPPFHRAPDLALHRAIWCLKIPSSCAIIYLAIQPGDETVSTGEAGLGLQAEAPGPRQKRAKQKCQAAHSTRSRACCVIGKAKA